MNILFVDQNNLQTTLRSNLLHDRHHNVTTIDNFEELKSTYNTDTFDIVVIDFDLHHENICIGKNCLEFIDASTPDQKVLTLSASSEYSDPYGCEHCVANHHRKRLNKPTPIRNIIRLIENFDDYPCDHYHEKNSS